MEKKERKERRKEEVFIVFPLELSIRFNPI